MILSEVSIAKDIEIFQYYDDEKPSFNPIMNLRCFLVLLIDTVNCFLVCHSYKSQTPTQYFTGFVEKITF